MVTKKKSSVAKEKGETALYTLKVTLLESNLPIWRKIFVPGKINLGYLHAVIQLSMGWTNSHLHQFIVGKIFYSDPDPRLEMEDIKNEYKMTLVEIAPVVGNKFLYEYDFGDGWMHKVEVEEIAYTDKLGNYALCLDGANACPPEDCGGIGGYYEMLKILRNPRHEEYQETLEWFDSTYGPGEFNIEETNSVLRKLKWANPSIEQLAVILEERDENTKKRNGANLSSDKK